MYSAFIVFIPIKKESHVIHTLGAHGCSSKVPSAGNLELLGVTLNPPFHCYACRTITWKQYRLRCEIFRRFCQLSKKTWNFIIKVAVQQRLSFSAKTGDVRWDCMCTDNSNTEFYYLCVKMIVLDVFFVFVVSCSWWEPLRSSEALNCTTLLLP